MTEHGPPAPAPDLATIQGLEEQLFDPAVRRSPEAVGALLSDGFVEFGRQFGRSGVVHDRDAVIAGLRAETDRAWSELTADGYELTPLGRDAVLLTYRTARARAASDDLHTLRSSIWVWTGEGWAMVFHQGTPTRPHP